MLGMSLDPRRVLIAKGDARMDQVRQRLGRPVVDAIRERDARVRTAHRPELVTLAEGELARDQVDPGGRAGVMPGYALKDPLGRVPTLVEAAGVLPEEAEGAGEAERAFGILLHEPL